MPASALTPLLVPKLPKCPHQLKMVATHLTFPSITSTLTITPSSSSSSSRTFSSQFPPLNTTNPPRFILRSFNLPLTYKIRSQRATISASSSTMAPATGFLEEVLPPALDSTSEPPPLFDGTTRLYISYTCPYAQRVWITRNVKGLQEQIKLVPIDLQNRPAWYKEKVYPPNKVPSLEHNGQVIGESLDLIKYIDTHFEGPSLSPSEPAKKVFADVLFSYLDSFHLTIIASFKEDGVKPETDAAFDFMEDALSKFSDGPFFLGQLSLVDIAYIPGFERYIPFFLEVKNHDFTAQRPKLAEWIQELNKIEGYKQTKVDPKVLVEYYKMRFLSKV